MSIQQLTEERQELADSYLLFLLGRGRVKYGTDKELDIEASAQMYERECSYDFRRAELLRTVIPSVVDQVSQYLQPDKEGFSSVPDESCPGLEELLIGVLQRGSERIRPWIAEITKEAREIKRLEMRYNIMDKVISF